jgi:hypothetical protein
MPVLLNRTSSAALALTALARPAHAQPKPYNHEPYTHPQHRLGPGPASRRQIHPGL